MYKLNTRFYYDNHQSVTQWGILKLIRMIIYKLCFRKLASFMKRISDHDSKLFYEEFVE